MTQIIMNNDTTGEIRDILCYDLSVKEIVKGLKDLFPTIGITEESAISFDIFPTDEGEEVEFINFEDFDHLETQLNELEIKYERR